MFGSIVSFFVTFWLLSSIPNYYLYGIYDEILLMPESYITLVFFSFSYILVDAGMTAVNNELMKIKQIRLEIFDNE